jgi:hypothetical protein
MNHLYKTGTVEVNLKAAETGLKNNASAPMERLVRSGSSNQKNLDPGVFPHGFLIMFGKIPFIL